KQKDGPNKTLLAAAGGKGLNFDCAGIFLLILFDLDILLLGWESIRKKKAGEPAPEPLKRGAISYLAGMVCAIIVLLCIKYYCPILPLVLVILLFSIWWIIRHNIFIKKKLPQNNPH